MRALKKSKQSKNGRSYRLQVLIEIDEDGNYISWCPALEGCYSQGDTFEEALANIQEVIGICVEELREEKRPTEFRYPEVIGFKHVEVTV